MNVIVYTTAALSIAATLVALEFLDNRFFPVLYPLVAVVGLVILQCFSSYLSVAKVNCTLIFKREELVNYSNSYVANST